MTGLQLEVFTPGAEMEMAKREDLAQKVAEAYREGHARGFAQGAEASAKEHADAQDQLRAQFVEALRDAQIEQAEAQNHVLTSLLPLMLALTDTLAPALAEAGLVTALETQLKAALAKRPEAVPVISCAPELEAGIKSALQHMEGRFRVLPDLQLTPLEARLAWDNGFDEINLDACLAAMRAQIAQFAGAAQAPETEKETLHAG
ncbi:MAG: hypothetical protein AAFY59_04360 [Pseudomonadota bacterium]